MFSWFLVIGAYAAPMELTDEAYWIDEPVVVTSGPSTWRLQRGYLFPIRDDAGPAGLTFVGEGTWEVHFPQANQAQQTANQLAMFAGLEAAALAPVARRQAPLSLDVDVGIWIADDVSDWLDQAIAVRKSRRGLTAINEDGTEVMIVTDHRSQGAARGIAQRQLAVRARWMQQHWRDPRVLLDLDRQFSHAEPSVIADFRTQIRWDRFLGVPGATLNRSPNVWLGAIADPRGILDAEASHQVVARATGEARRADEQSLSAQAFPHEEGERPRPPTRPVLEGMSVRVTLDPTHSASVVQTELEATLAVRASRHSVDHLVVSLPHTERGGWYSDPPLPDSWALAGVNDGSGRALRAFPLAITGDETEGRGLRRSFAVALAEPLKPDERQLVTVRWREQVRYRRQLITTCCIYDLGATTGLLPVAPSLHPTPAEAVPLQILAGTSATGSHRLVSSGRRMDTFRDEGHQWRLSESTLAEPVVALGRWKTFVEPAAGTMPEIGMAMRNIDARRARKLGVTVRQMLAFFDPLLPDYPTGQLELMESWSSIEDLSFRSADNIVSFTPLTTFEKKLDPVERMIRSERPHLETFLLGVSLASPYFARSQAALAEPRISTVLPRVYGLYLLESAHGDKPTQVWVDIMRDDARHHRQASVGRPWSDEGVATRVLALFGLFRHRHGDRALLAAVDHLASGRETASMDGLTRALERETGSAQTAFVDQWLHAGLAPRLHVAWTWEAGQLTVWVEADVPFGEYEVPVLIDDTQVWLRVSDGHGRLSLGRDAPPSQVDVHSAFPAPKVTVRRRRDPER